MVENKAQADIALIGLAVMGQNLILNMADHGFSVAAYNRTVSRLDEFLSSAAKGTSVIGARSLPELVAVLKKPRRIMFMVKAGTAVDELIQELVPLLEAGDILIDGGNSLFTDTQRRCAELGAKGLLYIGSGVSGGEEGARRGPALMPGGDARAWPYIKDIFQAIAAKASDGEPCCDWVGQGGAGHYVKMAHNGIEYGDMQIICEAYHLMRDGLGMSSEEMQQTFSRWNSGPLDSYLIGITADILAVKDADGSPLVERVLDAAGQKGTGKWTGISSLDLGVPLTLISEAVYARYLSAQKEERLRAAEVLKGPESRSEAGREGLVTDLEQALLAAKIVSYAQGFMLLREAAREYKWELDYSAIASIWRAGCIIRSVFLNKIKEAYLSNPDLLNLFMDSFFRETLEKCQPAWRRVIVAAVQRGIPVPALSSALSFYDGYRCARLPANLLQAQRDYFGAHTYERVDRPRGEFFHSDWSNKGA
ncbi:MAG: decarboxylating NADP(+)-dependent phosphogluconate dehydrogenase [Deltaproteobacteria bacterium]|nr:decarboxylating NADP(+)-dependent phosphogluconate dehydrogenase [Deltaproteobacteria bacterium]